jgi:hypothetical protein
VLWGWDLGVAVSAAAANAEIIEPVVAMTSILDEMMFNSIIDSIFKWNYFL